MTDLEPARQQPSGYGLTNTWKNGPVVIDGHEYAHGMVTANPETYCEFIREYAISQSYGRFRAVIGFADNTSDTTATTVRLEVDKKPIRSVVVRLGKPVSVDVNVQGAVRLGIAVENDDCDDLAVAFGDPRLE